VGPNKRKKRQQRPVLDERSLVTTVDGASILLDQGRDKTYADVHSGELESYLDGRRRRITMSSIRALVERRVAATRPSERARYPNQRPPPDDSPAPS
jgi:hypothetical protein